MQYVKSSFIKTARPQVDKLTIIWWDKLERKRKESLRKHPVKITEISFKLILLN